MAAGYKRYLAVLSVQHTMLGGILSVQQNETWRYCLFNKRCLAVLSAQHKILGGVLSVQHPIIGGTFSITYKTWRYCLYNIRYLAVLSVQHTILGGTVCTTYDNFYIEIYSILLYFLYNFFHTANAIHMSV